jgi:hypothetical protein
MNAQNIRQQNLAVEREHQSENEAAQALSSVDDIFLDQSLFRFDFANLAGSSLLMHEDEVLLDKWYEFSEEADRWFHSLFERAVLDAPAANEQGELLQNTPVPQNYLNQISDAQELYHLYTIAKQLTMDKKTFLGKPFGLFLKLDKLVHARNQVLENHKFCQNATKKFFFRFREPFESDACFKYLKKSIHHAVSLGVFLRKYRRDKRSEDFEAENVTPGMIIDFRDEDQRTDYLNPDVSEFVEVELATAERYYQRLVREKEEKEQELANERLRRAAMNPGQPGGRNFKSKKNNNNRKLSKRNQ